MTVVMQDVPGLGAAGAAVDPLRLFVESVRDYALVMLDPDGVVRTWNFGAECIKGYRPDEIIGRPFSTFYPPEDIQAGKCERELAEAARVGRVEDTGWRLRKDGTRFVANVVITAVRDASGALVGFGKVVRDIIERRLAEDALRQSEERFRLLTEGVQGYAIIMLDPDGRITSWNVGAEKIKGWTRDEILGQHFSRFYPPEEASGCDEILRTAIRDGRFEDFGWRMRKEGARFFANVLLTPLYGPDGGLRGFSKVTRDLTERRGAEETLRRSEDRFRLLVEGVGDYAIFMLDPTGHVLSWNTGAQRIKGYSPDEIIGRHFSAFYPPVDVRAGKCVRELETAARDGRLEDEGWRLRKDGKRFWANVVLTAVRTADGSLLGFSKITRDLTERRQAEEELRRSEERFRLLVDGVSDHAIFMLDPVGRVQSWNPGAERIKGYTRDEIVGQHFSRFYPAEDVAAGKCERELEGALHDGRFEDEGWRIRKDGARFWANVVLTAVHDDSGKLLGFAKITRDLTARRSAEQTQLRLVEEQVARRGEESRASERFELIGKLEAAVRARDDFLTVASHELKTPLHVLGLQVSTALFLLETQKAPAEKLAARLRKAQVEVQRVAKLLANLLDVSRVRADRLSMEPVDLDFVAVLRDVLERERDEIQRSGSTVTLSADAELHGHWDPMRVDQVVTNLLSNALKYGAGRPIAIALERRADRVQLVVADRGIGIAEADQARIFERFERAVSSRSYSGLGLGLWILAQILEAMGGSIAVVSQPGVGSTFTAELPLRAEAKGRG